MQLDSIRDDASLFSRLYIANQSREGDLGVFFEHENQRYPPSISEFGNIRQGTKSDLLKCLSSVAQLPYTPECTIFDGAFLLHTLQPSAAMKFIDYAANVFLKAIHTELKSSKRIDVVWDRYPTASLKDSTREKRGSGKRVKVSAHTKVPNKWKEFLRNKGNKTELFEYLSNEVVNSNWPLEKEVYITAGESVISKGNGSAMEECTHEEADTLIIQHIKHALENGYNKIKVRTGDTDVVVILIGLFFSLLRVSAGLQLVIAFGTGKDFCYYDINALCQELGPDKCHALPAFHAFTGTDITSFFFRRGKILPWKLLKCYPEGVEAFASIIDHPFIEVDIESELFKTLERFTILMYDKTSSLTNVNEARRTFFCKQAKGNLQTIPPSQVRIISLNFACMPVTCCIEVTYPFYYMFII